MQGRGDLFLSATGVVSATRPQCCLTPCKGIEHFKSLRPLEHHSYNVNLNNPKIAALLLWPPISRALVSLRPWDLWRIVHGKVLSALAIMLAVSNQSTPLE